MASHAHLCTRQRWADKLGDHRLPHPVASDPIKALESVDMPGYSPLLEFWTRIRTPPVLQTLSGPTEAGKPAGQGPADRAGQGPADRGATHRQAAT